jgi:hypothetical protein
MIHHEPIKFLILTLDLDLYAAGGWVADIVAGHALINANVLAVDILESDGLALSGVFAARHVASLRIDKEKIIELFHCLSVQMN